MVFGELVIPSSRSLWDDDVTELTPHVEIPIKWDDNSASFPTEITALIVIDTKPVIDVFDRCVTAGLTPCKTSSRDGLRLYRLNDNIHLLTYESRPNRTSGEVVSSVSALIDGAVDAYGITSQPIAGYQGNDRLDEESCTIFSLTTPGLRAACATLPVPNMVTGVCANLLTYRLCRNAACAAFVGYLDASPLDSANTANLLELVRRLGVRDVGPYSLKMEAPSNNLYM